MRKQWVKRENIYHKPFYKQKLKVTLLGVIVMAIIFFIYQVFYIKELQEEIEHKASVQFQPPPAVRDSKPILRGIRLKDYDLYNPVVRNNFYCLETGQMIPLARVNDNYCDCIEDGSDETETNACENGVFYCTFQKRHVTGRGRDVYIQSSRINDGICDCCDGSDEWLERDGVVPKCPHTCAEL